MDNKLFVSSVLKVLAEELPFCFQLSIHQGNYGIVVTCPNNFGFSVSLPKIYIGFDHSTSAEKYSGYIIYNNTDFYLGDSGNPQEMGDVLVSFLQEHLDKEISSLGRLDFMYSDELKNFLGSNNYSMSNYSPDSPDLIRFNDGESDDVIVGFSEYNGNVLTTVNLALSKPDGISKYLEVYRGELNHRTQGKVFSDILRCFHNEEIRTDTDLVG